MKIAPAATDLVNRYEYHLDFPGDPLNAGCDYERWARRLTKGTKPTVYAHVATDPGYPGKLALQYWFFYPFNDFNNTHEGDWEMTQLVFDAADAQRGARADAASRSDTARTRAPSARPGATRSSRSSTEPTRSSTRPPARTRTSSRRALYLGSSAEAGVGCDDTLGPHRELRPVVKTIPSDAAAAETAFPWIAFEGRWGELAEGVLQRADRPEPEGPVDAPDRLVAGLARPELRGARGRRLRHGRDRPLLHRRREGIEGSRPPAPEPGARRCSSLGAILALLVFAVVRATWRPAAPLRVARRRTWGQIISASAAHVRAARAALPRPRPAPDPDHDRDHVAAVARARSGSTCSAR